MILSVNPSSGNGAAIHVTGTPDPDCTGYYFHRGSHNEWKYYARHDDAYYIWSNPADEHFLTTAVDDTAAGWWFNPDPGHLGIYVAGDTYTGQPVVRKKPRLYPLGETFTVTQKNSEEWLLKQRRRGKQWHKKMRIIANEWERKRRVKIQNTFGRCARLFAALSPAMKLIWVGDGDRVLTARNRERCLARGLRRWMQVQFPLMLAGFPLEATTHQRIPYLIADFALTWLGYDEPWAGVSWRWNRQSLLTERVVLHISQLPPAQVFFVGDGSEVWRYARLIGSWDYSVKFVDPGWFEKSEYFELIWGAARGETVQLYGRFELMNNPNPPVSQQESIMTTEDWTHLRMTRIF